MHIKPNKNTRRRYRTAPPSGSIIVANHTTPTGLGLPVVPIVPFKQPQTIVRNNHRMVICVAKNKRQMGRQIEERCNSEKRQLN